ncbi:P-loop containing nucleoside triphosphate hydrolase protein [Cantharellus anzutake]|uniref:P-loop containing nucleoside triphosphate hydrolase protein n=1 Tax=Cantharellus anzutake TaxID=1750568 RepID=UPI001903D2E0|nr:P-loop containing nucleoside triphosphate hydrolase protein [Cantharellus anzutake]KAF8341248.1 P-loop containing nucleoside triphosphate hydrolase protein [Cantharellus anzutake]
MDAFYLLSRGGVHFDKTRFKKDVQLFDSKPPEASKPLDGLQPGELPQELDFFKYAQKNPDDSAKQKGKGKRKERNQSLTQSSAEEKHESTSNPKKRKADDLDEDRIKAMAQQDISTTGVDVPPRITEFSDLAERYSVPAQLLKNLAEYGFEVPTAIQSQGIPILLEQRDMAAISPTGTGKTLAFLLPIFSKLEMPSSSKTAKPEVVGVGIRAIVLAPTRELASQIYNEALKLARGRKWRMVLFNGGVISQKEARDKTDIMISTPMRLVAAIQEGTIELDNVRYLIFDEADRLLEGNFRTQVEEIMRACSHPLLKKALFSATLPEGVEKLARSFLFDPIRVIVGTKDSAPLSIKQSLVYVGNEAGKLATLLQLLANAPPVPLLVFVQSRERAAELHQELVYDEVSVDSLHADLTPKQREESFQRLREGKTWVMISTEVMARGMDFGGIRAVLNYDFPQSVQSYIHRIGRTGRAGREGDAITYFTLDDAPYLKSIANVISASGWTIPEWISKLPSPSTLKRRLLKRAPIKREPIRVSSGRTVFLDEERKARAATRGVMTAGNKRRKLGKAEKTKRKTPNPQGNRKDGAPKAVQKVDINEDD